MRHVIALALVASPLLAAAQSATVSPGMSRARVIAALGEPVTARDASGYTYLFYRNECGRACGMNDLVVLRGDSVVDAIFRSPSRRYTGTSSSPEPVAQVSARARPARASKEPHERAEKRAPAKPEPVKAPPAKPAPAKPAPAKPAPAKPAPAKPAPAASPKSRAVAPAPAGPLKPSAPNDTRPSIPAGEPPARKTTSVPPIKPITP